MAPAAPGGDRFASGLAPAAPRAGRLAPAVAPAAAPLLDPQVLTEGAAQDSHDSISLKKQGGTIVLCARPLEVQNPYWKDGPPIRFSPEVASAHKDKVLCLFRSSHGTIRNRYFVCSPNEDVVQLPDVLPPENLLPQSIGLVNLNSVNLNSVKYQIAHLLLTSNPTTGLIQGSLTRWWYSSSLSSTGTWITDRSEVNQHLEVNLPGLRGNHVKWQTHRVISLEDTGMLWPDLKQGILLLHLDKEVKFDLVSLPSNLPPIKYNPWRKTCPEQFRSVGCCNGSIFFVNLHTSSSHHHTSSGTNIIEVGIWVLIPTSQGGGCNWWWIKKNYVHLDCQSLWNNFMSTRGLSLPWPNSVPSFPILDENKSDILYLTVGGEKKKKAWLLEIDVHTQTLKNVREYPGYSIHMKPPFPTDLSKYMPHNNVPVR